MLTRYEDAFTEYILWYKPAVGSAKCTKCHARINNISQKLECAIDPRHLANKKIPDLDIAKTELSFMALPSIFVGGAPFFLCRDCKHKVWRFIGLLPDIFNNDKFPRRVTSYLSDEYKQMGSGKKSPPVTIEYNGKAYKDSKKTYNRLALHAIKNYKKKYPECSYTQKELYKILQDPKLSLSKMPY